MKILFQNIWFVKEFLVCNDCFGLFNKKGSGINFWCIFIAWFFHKNATYLILYQLTVSTSCLYYRVSNKMCYYILNYTIDDVINFKIYLQSFPKQWPREGDEGESEIQKCKYLENERNFLDEVKSIFFHNYLSAIIFWIKEKYRTQVLSYHCNQKHV